MFPQIVPQPPQFAGSVWLSTQALPHSVVPAVQVVVQTPAEHPWPPRQAVPQAPQLAESVCVLTHSPAHNVVPEH